MKCFLAVELLLIDVVLQISGKIIHVDNGNAKSDSEGGTSWLSESLQLQRMSLELAQANYSAHQDLPRHEVDARIEEARARKAKAHAEYLAAQHPFNQTESRYNLGYIGRGYDILYGNPLPEEGVIDRGFRLPILELKYGSRVSSDGRYRLPDNVDVIEEPSSSFSSSVHEVATLNDYQHMLSAQAKASGSGGGWFVRASFSASASYASQQQELDQGTTMHVNLLGRAAVYHARLATSAHQYKVSSFFEDAVAALPNQACSSVGDTSMEPYLQVIRDFGTHFTSDVTMGASSVQRVFMRTSDVSNFSRMGVSASMAASISGGFFGESISGSASASLNLDQSTLNQLKSMDKETMQYYIGGTPPSANISLLGNTEALQAWTKTATQNPAPIIYTLVPLEDLLRSDAIFTSPMPELISKRECLRKALAQYCTENSPDPSTCNAQSQKSSLKSSLAAAASDVNVNVTANTIKYGDYVSLSNNQSQAFGNLMFTDTIEWTSDESVCYGLRYGNLTSENGDIFQILPARGKGDLLGSPVRYGERFRLNGKRGSNIILGIQKYKNVEVITSDSLEYFFENNIFDTQTYIRTRAMCAPDLNANMYILKLTSTNPQNCTFTNATAQFILEGGSGIYTWEIQFPNGELSNLYKSLVSNTLGQLKQLILKPLPRSLVSNGCTILFNLIDVKIKMIYKQCKDVGTLQTNAGGAWTGNTTLDLNSSDYFNIGSMDARLMDKAYHTELAMYNTDKRKGPGTVVEDQDIGVIHVMSPRPRPQRYWGLAPPDLLEASSEGQVTVREQVVATRNYSTGIDCSTRLDLSSSTLFSASSGHLNNTTPYDVWQFADTDIQRYIQFTFPGLARIERTSADSSPPQWLVGNSSVLFKDRNTNEWISAVTSQGKKITVASPLPSDNGHIITDAVRYTYTQIVKQVDLFFLGIEGCFLDTEGVNIQTINIPESLKWSINLEDLAVTIDPVFAVAAKSSVPTGYPDVNDDTYQEQIKVTIPLADDVSICNIDDNLMSNAIRTMLRNPVAIFKDFDGTLENDQGAISLTLTFTIVSYSDYQKELLKAEADTQLPKNGNLLPCYPPAQRGYGYGGTGSNLRPVDYFFLFGTVMTMLALGILAVVVVRKWRKQHRAQEYRNLDDEANVQQVERQDAQE